METNRGSWRGRRLYRSRRERFLGGVAGGLGEYLGVDPTLIRLLFIVGCVLTGGVALLAYPILWVVVPKTPLLTASLGKELPRRAADIPPIPPA